MDISPGHEKYMNRCLELAKLGLGYTAPNPLVGAVIVFENRIIGEGYHRRYGASHAEVNAIESVKDKALLHKSSLYVNLEPCSHTGKTPPCADLIIRCGIPEVIIGTVDPHDIVAGSGIQKMKDAGIRVTSGISRPDCIKLNRRFFTFHVRKRPYIILKWAQSEDGFIDVVRDGHESAGPNWITGEVSRKLVHKWRAEEQAILVGTNTALIDNPHLNVREWKGNSPVRVVLDRSLRLPECLHLFDNQFNTMIVNEKKEDTFKKCTYHKIKFDNNLLSSVMKLLVDQFVQSVIVEGGKQVLESFIRENLWDEARIFTGRKTFVNGIPAPILKSQDEFQIRIDQDNLRIVFNSALGDISSRLPV